MTAHDPRPIALIGLTGAGKSAVARVLGERLGTVVADLDQMLEAEEGLTVSGLFARSGESWFRRREAEIFEQALRAGAGVVACGGGVVLEAASRRALRERCRVVWLEVPPAEAARRVAGELGTRPLLAGRDPETALEDLLARRTPLYAEAAEFRIATLGLTPEAVAEQIERALEGRP